MIRIDHGHGVVTLISSFSCEPENQQPLIDAWISATAERQGGLAGIIRAALDRKKVGTRVVNCAPWKSAENWESLVSRGKRILVW